MHSSLRSLARFLTESVEQEPIADCGRRDKQDHSILQPLQVLHEANVRLALRCSRQRCLCDVYIIGNYWIMTLRRPYTTASGYAAQERDSFAVLACKVIRQIIRQTLWSMRHCCVPREHGKVEHEGEDPKQSSGAFATSTHAIIASCALVTSIAFA